MGRTPKAGWYPSLGGWYATVGGVRYRLADRREDKGRAERALHKLLSQEIRPKATSRTEGHSLSWITHRFLDEVKRTLEPNTLTEYTRKLKSLCDKHGHLAADAIRPHHITEWLASQPGWGPTTQANAVTITKRLYRWSKKSGYLDANPIEEMERPRALVKDKILTGEQFRTILKGCQSRDWKDLLTALHQTGCRQCEVFRLTAADVDLIAGTWSVLNKTRRKTTQRRTIYLTPIMVAITKRLVAARPTGPLFLCGSGKPWSINRTSGGFFEFRRKYGYGHEATTNAIRHLYITDALERGVPIATVAELVGHTDTKMIMRVYSKLRERTAHLREAAAQARPPEPSDDYA